MARQPGPRQQHRRLPIWHQQQQQQQQAVNLLTPSLLLVLTYPVPILGPAGQTRLPPRLDLLVKHGRKHPSDPDVQPRPQQQMQTQVNLCHDVDTNSMHSRPMCWENV